MKVRELFEATGDQSFDDKLKGMVHGKSVLSNKEVRASEKAAAKAEEKEISQYAGVKEGDYLGWLEPSGGTFPVDPVLLKVKKIGQERDVKAPSKSPLAALWKDDPREGWIAVSEIVRGVAPSQTPGKKIYVPLGKNTKRQKLDFSVSTLPNFIKGLEFSIKNHFSGKMRDEQMQERMQDRLQAYIKLKERAEKLL